MANENEKFEQEFRDAVSELMRTTVKKIDLDMYQRYQRDFEFFTEQEKTALMDEVRSFEPGSADKENAVSCLHNAFIVLALNGCNKLAFEMLQLMPIVSTLNEAASIYAKTKEREMKSAAGKKRKSKHKDMALQIAADTWAVYPNASRAGMADKIREYILSIPGSKPVPNIERFDDWLKESGLCPNVKIRNRNFQLIINKEGV